MAIAQTPSVLQAIIASKTYNAAWFSGSTIEAQIQNAINAAAADGALYVFVPANMLPYNATLVTFNTSVRMIREGGDFSVWDIEAYGASGDGVTDATIAIQAAISACSANFGGIVYLPQGVYNITSTILVSVSGVRLRGASTFYNADVGGISNIGTQLSWQGAASGIILKYAPTTGASAQALKAVELSNVSLLGNTLAGIGLQVLSTQGSRFSDLWIRDCTIAGLDLNVVTPLGENGGVTRCLFERINIRQVAATAGIGIRADGNAAASPSAANVSNCDFLGISMLHSNGNGVDLTNCDSNRFYGLNVNRVGGMTGIGIALHGSATSGAHCRANALFFASGGAGGVTAYGVGLAFPSKENAFYFYTQENSEPIPTIEAGATLFYATSHHPVREVSLTLILSSVFTNLPAGDNEWNSDTSFRAESDLSAYSQFRLLVPVAVQGAAGTNVRVQYSTNGGSSFAGNLDGSAGPAVLIDSTGMKDSGWTNITAAARVDNVVLRLLSNGGDGVADPKISARLLLR